MEKLSYLFRAVWKALAMARSSLLTSSPKPFSCVSSLLFFLTKSQSPLQMRKLCENNFRKFVVSSKLTNLGFPVDLHPENSHYHPQQTAMMPTPPLAAPPNICLSPWTQPQHLCYCRRAAGDDHPLEEGGDFLSLLFT